MNVERNRLKWIKAEQRKREEEEGKEERGRKRRARKKRASKKKGTRDQKWEGQDAPRIQKLGIRGGSKMEIQWIYKSTKETKKKGQIKQTNCPKWHNHIKHYQYNQIYTNPYWSLINFQTIRKLATTNGQTKKQPNKTKPNKENWKGRKRKKKKKEKINHLSCHVVISSRNPRSLMYCSIFYTHAYTSFPYTTCNHTKLPPRLPGNRPENAVTCFFIYFI